MARSCPNQGERIYPRTSPPSIGMTASGHIIGQVGSKELDHFGTILDSSEPTKGNQLGSIPITLNAARNDRRHDPCGRDDAGRDAVHRDSERPEILRQIPRVMGDSGFRCPVMSIAAIDGGVRSWRLSLPL